MSDLFSYVSVISSSVICLSIIYLSLTDSLYSSFPKENIKQPGCKGAPGLTAILQRLLLWCECRSKRARELVCAHAHISVFPSYCKFSSKLLRESEGLLSAKKCHINSHTRTHTHSLDMHSGVYIFNHKCRHWLMVVKCTHTVLHLCAASVQCIG